MELAFFILLNGLSYGLLLFMLSAGLTLIFSMMGVLNFAHASFYMLGAYLSYTVSGRIGFWPALFIAPMLVALIGAAVERYGLRFIHRYGHIPELLFTFGLSYVIAELVQLVWGRAAVPYAVPPELDRPLFTLFAASFPAYRAFMMTVALLMMASVWLALTRTRIGLVIQAALTKPQMVEALGHNVPRVFMLVFAGGCALAGLAGAIGGPAFVTEPGMAHTVGSIIFVVVVVGGLGSLGGALLASLLIGVAQTLTVTIDYSLGELLGVFGLGKHAAMSGHDLLSLTISQFAPVLPYLLLLLTLIFRPQGLMGNRET